MATLRINIIEKLYAWFYTKSETDDLLNKKANSTHTHTKIRLLICLILLQVLMV